MEFKVKNKEDLEKFITEKWNTINAYIDSEMDGLDIPLYNSVDIRESAHKLAPVDNNIYPAGFNNVCMLDLESASINLEKFILKINPQAKTIGIISESNTKNTFYLDHLAYLKKALLDAGFPSVEIISFDNDLFDSNQELELVTASNFDLTIHKAAIKDSKICIGSGEIDFSIMNNDQSNPIELDWDNISTPIHPSPKIGWYNRSKSGHFLAYHNALEKFCQHFSINPDLLEAKFKLVDGVDFSAQTGLEELAKAVDEVKSTANENQKVFIKGDQGTYGMGISVVSSGEDVLSLNRKSRKKMDIGKNKIKFTSVIVQEGIETILKYDNMPAEVTIYLVGGKSVGGFMRTNSNKGAHENLNSRGMVFKKFCISEIRQNQDHKAKEALYSIIARLSSLASAHEVEKVK